MTLKREDLTRLYERYARALLAFFQRRVADPEIAVDLTADTFTLALERRKQFRGTSDEQLSGWLWSIARSVLRDHERRNETARRGSRRLGRERRMLTDREIERIEELAASKSIRDAVVRSLDRLPADQREAVRRHVLAEEDYDAIARDLDCSPAVVRQRVSRGIATLRKELES